MQPAVWAVPTRASRRMRIVVPSKSVPVPFWQTSLRDIEPCCTVLSSLSSRQKNVISLSLKTLAVGCNQANVKFCDRRPPGTRQTHRGVPAHREGMGHRKVSPYSSELPEARIRWLSPRSQPAPVELKITSVSVVTLPDGMMQLSRSAEREAFDNLTRIATPTQTQNTSATHAAAHLNLAGLTAGQRRQHR